MSKLDVQKVTSPEDRRLPIFAEFDKIAKRIRERAYELFANRPVAEGHELDDWLNAQHEIRWPAAELIEEDDEFDVKVALPGFKLENISVTATPRELIVKGSQQEQSDEQKNAEKGKVRWSEFHRNDVFRQIELPSDVDVARISAEFDDGVLKIEAPKKKGAGVRARTVKVKASD
jgi:HSP20 family protein